MQIRAANLSGDCTFIREVERFVAQKKYAFPLFKQQQVCIISCRTCLGCHFCALLVAQGAHRLFDLHAGLRSPPRCSFNDWLSRVSGRGRMRERRRQCVGHVLQ